MWLWGIINAVAAGPLIRIPSDIKQGVMAARAIIARRDMWPKLNTLAAQDYKPLASLRAYHAIQAERPPATSSNSSRDVTRSEQCNVKKNTLLSKLARWLIVARSLSVGAMEKNL